MRQRRLAHRVLAGGIAVLGPMLLAACGDCGSAQSVCDVNTLQSRLTGGLGPDIAAGRVLVQPLPDGARVVVDDAALFPGSGTELNDSGQMVVSRVVQGMLDPHLMHYEIADSSAMAPGVPQARTQAVLNFFNYPWVGPVTAGPVPAGAVVPPPGETPLPATIITAHTK